MPGDDSGKGCDYVLDPLAGRQQAEREQDVRPLDAEAVFVEVGIGELHVGDAMGDHVDSIISDAVYGTEEFPASIGHHGHAGREVKHLVEHPLLVGGWPGEYRVERCMDRHPQVVEQVEHVPARRATEDAVFVLQRHHVDVGEIEKLGSPAVGGGVAIVAGEADLGWIVVVLTAVVHGHDEAVGLGQPVGDGRAEVVGERRQSAAPRNVVAHERDPVE